MSYAVAARGAYPKLRLTNSGGKKMKKLAWTMVFFGISIFAHAQDYSRAHLDEIWKSCGLPLALELYELLNKQPPQIFDVHVVMGQSSVNPHSHPPGFKYKEFEMKTIGARGKVLAKWYQKPLEIVIRNTSQKVRGIGFNIAKVHTHRFVPLLVEFSGLDFDYKVNPATNPFAESNIPEGFLFYNRRLSGKGNLQGRLFNRSTKYETSYSVGTHGFTTCMENYQP